MGRLNRQKSQSDSLADETIEVKAESSVDDNLAEEMSSARVSAVKDEPSSDTSRSPSLAPTRPKTENSQSSSTLKAKPKAEPDAATVKIEPNHTNGEVSPKKEAMPPTAKSRRSTKKNVPRIAPLFDDLPDATDEANSGYQVINACIYQNKFLGYTEHAMECDCNEEWGK